MPDERIIGVRFGQDRIWCDLEDGRVIGAPLAWFPRLASASEEQRSKWEKSPAGVRVHWPELGEALSAGSLLRGARAPESAEAKD
jgi:Protein of unknown function (DUF2442)